MKNVAFPVYYNWYDWLRENLPPEERCEVTDALRDYYETGADPVPAVRESLRLVVSLMREQIDYVRQRSKQASEAGKISAAKRKERSAATALNGAETEPDAPPTNKKEKKRKNKKEKEKDSSSLSYERARGEDLTPPTFWEVWDYVKKECVDIDARKFFDYYESVGWRERGQPIVNWKAKAELWELRGRDFAG